MRFSPGTALVAALTGAALGACPQPTTPPTTQQGPGHGAFRTYASRGEATQPPRFRAFTEREAREHLKNAGFSNISGLARTPEGVWVGKATKGANPVAVSVDFRGAVSAT